MAVNSVSNSIASKKAVDSLAAGDLRAKQDEKEDEVRAAFQKFVAGTFYKQMLKSMRKMAGQPAYFHGGQAEEMFQNQMDDIVTDDLATKQGAAFSDQLFQTFAAQLRAPIVRKAPAGSPQPPRPQDPKATVGFLEQQAKNDIGQQTAFDARLASGSLRR